MSYQNNYEIQIKEAEEQVLVTRRNKMSVEEFGTYYWGRYRKDCQGTHDHKRSGNGHLP